MTSEPWKAMLASPGRLQVDWGKLISLALSFGLSLWTVSYMIDRIDPDRSAKEATRLQKIELERRLGRKIPALVGLEGQIAAEVIDPDDIDVTLADIGGLDVESRTLAASIMLPLRHSHLFDSFLLHQPNGILLYGPPGTGKTMLAKAIAREAGANFISIKASTLQSKWFGQSQKMVRAVFSLASKLAPAIIFLDEVDGILGKRRDQDHEITTTMKTEFMQLWDGLDSKRGAQVLVLGATNRQTGLDPAVLRRFTLQIKVPMPDEAARVAILEKVLRRHATTSPVDPLLLETPTKPSVSESLESPTSCSATKSQLQELSAATEGYSGSDLMELCSQAAIIPVQEFIEATATQSNASVTSHSLGCATVEHTAVKEEPLAPRALTLRDALEVVRRNSPSRADMTAEDILVSPNELMAGVLGHILKQTSSPPPLPLK